MACFCPHLACGYCTTRANAKHHIVNHLAFDAFVWGARFQDAHVANSDTNPRRLKGLLLKGLLVSADPGSKYDKAKDSASQS